MTTKTRRGRGDDSIYFDKSKGSYVGEISLGYRPDGKRRRRKVYGRTKGEVRDKLKDLRGEIEDGITSVAKYTVGDAVRKWLEVGLKDCDPGTVAKNRSYAEKHLLLHIGAAKLREFTADDVDAWLEDRANVLASSTLSSLLSILRRSITLAQRRKLVGQNVAELGITTPKGTQGRPSKSLTPEQVAALLNAKTSSWIYAYVVVSLLIGIRTEEARALTWDRTHLEQAAGVPARVEVWRSVRATGDTKTEKSRRTLRLPQLAVDALKTQKARQAEDRLKAGVLWQENDLVFCTKIGTPLDAANVRRAFRRAVKSAGIVGEWTPRELRHSFVSLLSANGVTLEAIAQLVGHASTRVTEVVYRHELRPVLQDGAEVIDGIFGNRSAG
jgi:integrase